MRRVLGRWFGHGAPSWFWAWLNFGDMSRLSTRSPEPEDMPGFWSECSWTVLAGLLTMALGGLFIFLAPGEFWRDDSQSGMMPAYVEAHRALQEGSLPLISRCSWMAGRLASENRCLFSVFHLGVLLFVFRLGLPLAQTANAIILIYLAVYGSGAFRLGRAGGLMRPNALVVAFAAALNGYLLYWVCQSWMNLLFSTAWLAWLWWGLLIASKRRHGAWRFVPAGLFLYLLVMGGLPHTDVMAAIVTVWVVLRNIFTASRVRKVWRLASARRTAAAVRVLFGRTMAAKLWPIGAAWGLGLALASPALLMFVVAYGDSTRAAGLLAFERSKWTVPADAALDLILPAMKAHWKTFVGPWWRDGFEVYAGFVPVVALLATLLRRRLGFIRRHAWEFSFLLCAAILCSIGHWGSFRWPFRWLPLLHLVLGLLGARALQEWPLPRKLALRRPWTTGAAYLGCWGMVFVLAVREVALGRSPTDCAMILRCATLLLKICALWVVFDAITCRWPRLYSWVAPVVMAVAVLGPWQYFTSIADTPQWRLDERVREPGLLDKERLYFAFLSKEDAYSTDSENGLRRRFANTAMYAGVKFVNGYVCFESPIAGQLLPMNPFGFMSPDEVGRVLPREARPDGLLAMMGVDGIVLGKDYAGYAKALEELGWKVVAKTTRDVLLHWPGPRRQVARPLNKVAWVNDPRQIAAWIHQRGDEACPPILLTREPDLAGKTTILQPVAISAIEESRQAVRCRVENPSRRLCGGVIFSRAWYLGYQASLDGEPLEVHAVNGLQPFVLLPPGAKGELLLQFAPYAVRYGLMIALAGSVLAVVGPWCLRGRAKRRRARAMCCSREKHHREQSGDRRGTTPRTRRGPARALAKFRRRN